VVISFSLRDEESFKTADSSSDKSKEVTDFSSLKRPAPTTCFAEDYLRKRSRKASNAHVTLTKSGNGKVKQLVGDVEKGEWIYVARIS
jgi:hypothetical protein